MNRSTADNAGAAEKRRDGAAWRLRGLVPGWLFSRPGLHWARGGFRAQRPVFRRRLLMRVVRATKEVLQRLGSPVEIRFIRCWIPAPLTTAVGILRAGGSTAFAIRAGGGRQNQSCPGQFVFTASANARWRMASGHSILTKATHVTWASRWSRRPKGIACLPGPGMGAGAGIRSQSRHCRDWR